MVTMTKEIVAIENTFCDVWKKDDRACVILFDKGREKILLEFWDAEVSNAIECGFLNPKDFHKSAYEYYKFLNLPGDK